MKDFGQNVEDYDIPFLGEVVFNEDPEKLQRVKVTVPGTLEGDPSTLPWVLPIPHSPFGFGPGFGVCHVPEIGSAVLVKFQQGSIYYGLVNGSVPKKSNPLPAQLQTNYPKRWGFKDPAGNVFFMDRTSGSRSVEFHHASGNFHLVISDTGALEIQSTQTVFVHTTSSATLTADGGATINAVTTINGDTTINGVTVINGHTTVNADTAMNGNLSVTGTITSDTSVSTPIVDASTSLKVDGLEMKGHKHPFFDNTIGGAGASDVTDGPVAA